MVGPFSTPFCRLTTTASGASSGAISRATASVSVDLTQKSTRSAPDTEARLTLASA